MWDESFPVYNGSLEHRLIVGTLYARVGLYYILILLGLLSTLVLVTMPFLGFYLGYKSIIVKFKEDKHNNKVKKHKDHKNDISQNVYLDRLDKNLKKKKKHHNK